MYMNNKGFTLIEILAVIAIIAILSGIGIIAYSKYKSKWKVWGGNRRLLIAIILEENQNSPIL